MPVKRCRIHTHTVQFALKQFTEHLFVLERAKWKKKKTKKKESVLLGSNTENWIERKRWSDTHQRKCGVYKLVLFCGSMCTPRIWIQIQRIRNNEFKKKKPEFLLKSAIIESTWIATVLCGKYSEFIINPNDIGLFCLHKWLGFNEIHWGCAIFV